MAEVTIGVTQMACTDDAAENHDHAERLVRAAAGKGANVVLVQELFEGFYFCQQETPENFARACEADRHPAIQRFSAVARELGIVMPVSFFERHNNAHYNSIAMVDADGSVLGIYRKSHIPDGPGYEEKFYFNPGDTGFKVWETAYGKVGVGICWDQWFPETARCMVLQGAEMLLYPTAIGNEPNSPDYDSKDHWQTAMRGHAAANMVPLAAANRIGTEHPEGGTPMSFYGSSFIADWTGRMVAEAGREEEAVLTHTFELDRVRQERIGWGVFRDRRPDLYGAIGTLSGARA
ncbi:MAG: N-carbamoylputrescine amidase [Pseudomonadota bacterium]